MQSKKPTLMETFQLGLSSFLLLSSLVSSLNSDGFSLLALKAAITTDPNLTLSTWSETDATPCNWVGISCVSGRVSEISLPNKGLTGYIPSEIGALVYLRNLSLRYNNFSNPIPSRLFNASSLVSLDLSHNTLTGSIPHEIEILKTLTHLDLSSNLLNGTLPSVLSDLSELSGTLNLSNNQFSGEIPASFGKFPVVVSLDLRHNNLSGAIPQTGSLLNQGPTAFSANPNLCGFPLRNPCPNSTENNPKIPKTPNTNLSTIIYPPPAGKEQGRSIAVPIISAVFFIVGVVMVSVWFFWKKWGLVEGKMGKGQCGKKEREEEGQKGEFFVVDEEGFGLELEELLRASAYVVGKSRNGIVYKVVAGRGMVVAVRRLSEGGGGFRRFKEFEAEVEAIARVRHPNIVRLRAYYYARDEKLLVSDFITNGSLYAALHGGLSNSSPPLSWAVRLKIVQGAARGLAHLHECSPRKYVHGNIKSSKILLDNDFEAYISGFGLSRLVSATHKPSDGTYRKQSSTQIVASSKTPMSPSMNYSAPEARFSSNRLTQKCDVYSFGIVLLEILTGRLADAKSESEDAGLESFVRRGFKEERPLSEIIDQSLLHEVYAKKQVVAVFHIALGCTDLDPEMRHRMRVVSESLDRIGVQ